MGSALFENMSDILERRFVAHGIITQLECDMFCAFISQNDKSLYEGTLHTQPLHRHFTSSGVFASPVASVPHISIETETTLQYNDNLLRARGDQMSTATARATAISKSAKFDKRQWTLEAIEKKAALIEEAFDTPPGAKDLLLSYIHRHKQLFMEELLTIWRIIAILRCSMHNEPLLAQFMHGPETTYLDAYMRVWMFLAYPLHEDYIDAVEIISAFIYGNIMVTTNMMNVGTKAISHPCMTIGLPHVSPTKYLELIDNYLRNHCGVGVSITGLAGKEQQEIINHLIEIFSESTSEARGSGLMISCHAFDAKCSDLINIPGSSSATLGVNTAIVLDDYFLALLANWIDHKFQDEPYYHVQINESFSKVDKGKMWDALMKDPNLFHNICKDAKTGTNKMKNVYTLTPVDFPSYMSAIFNTVSAGHGVYIVCHRNMVGRYDNIYDLSYIPCVNLCTEVTIPSSMGRAELCSLGTVSLASFIPMMQLDNLQLSRISYTLKDILQMYSVLLQQMLIVGTIDGANRNPKNDAYVKTLKDMPLGISLIGDAKFASCLRYKNPLFKKETMDTLKSFRAAMDKRASNERELINTIVGKMTEYIDQSVIKLVSDLVTPIFRTCQAPGGRTKFIAHMEDQYAGTEFCKAIKIHATTKATTGDIIAPTLAFLFVAFCDLKDIACLYRMEANGTLLSNGEVTQMIQSIKFFDDQSPEAILENYAQTSKEVGQSVSITMPNMIHGAPDDIVRNIAKWVSNAAREGIVAPCYYVNTAEASSSYQCFFGL